jgi:hypothetical protein
MTTDLRLVEARWRLGMLTWDGLPDLADTLIREGVDTPELWELAATAKWDLLWEGEPIFDRLCTEQGVRLTSAPEAALVLARDIARLTLAGELTAGRAAGELEELWRRSGFEVDELSGFHELVNSYDFAADAEADPAWVDDEVRRALRRLLDQPE